MKKSALIAAGVLFGVIAVAGVTVYKVRQNKDAKAAAGSQPYEPMEAIETVKAVRVEWQPLTELTGTVIARRSVRVQNEVPGVVKAVRFESGEVVDAGQVLVLLDDSTDRADLAAAEAAVRVKRADLKVVDARIALAESEFRRQDEALKVQATSAMELDRARAEVDKAQADRARVEAEIDEELARVEQIKVRLAKFTIKAPFRGRVGMRSVHEGQFLPADMGFGGGAGGGAAVATIEEVGDTIYLDFAIPQEYLPRVQPGLTVKADSPLLGDAPVLLKVLAVDSSANTQTRNVRIRTEADNRTGLLRPGMSVRVRVPIDVPTSFVAVPATAVRRESYGTAVFVIVTDDKGAQRASQRFVKLGPVVGDPAAGAKGNGPGTGVQSSGWIAILDGVKEGETVASTGSFKLLDGVKVVVVPPGGVQPVGFGPQSGAPAADAAALK